MKYILKNNPSQLSTAVYTFNSSMGRGITLEFEASLILHNEFQTYQACTVGLSQNKSNFSSVLSCEDITITLKMAQ